MKYRGTVQKGLRRGQELGFPTANIPYDGMERGIFAAIVRLDDSEYRAAVYADNRRKLLEAHLTKYSGGDLYGKEMDIELLQKIREDMAFKSDSDLKAAIAADVQAVRQYFLAQKHHGRI
jgi:riboflavin kinase/FMN adenylyltransferase